MKKLLFAIFLLLSQFSLQAQTEKGRWNAGVNIGHFSYQSSEVGHNFSGSISPSAGTFVARNLLIGVGIPFSVSSLKANNTLSYSINRTTSVGLTPFIRYYLGQSSLKPFVGAAVTYSLYRFRNETAAALYLSKGAALQVTPSVGLAYFINRNVSIDAQLGYNWYRYKASITDSSNGGSSNDYPASTSRSASLSLGFSVFFGQ